MHVSYYRMNKVVHSRWSLLKFGYDATERWHQFYQFVILLDVRLLLTTAR